MRQPGPGRTIRILIADDHLIFREGLRKLLDGEPDLRVIGEAASGAEAVRLARTLTPDLVLFDWKMNGASPLPALRELCREPGARVLLLTAAIDPQDLAAALTVGVRGVVMKQSAAAVLVDHIRRVMRGQAWVGDVASAPEAESDLDFGLTAREAEVASAVAAGYGNKDIARRLAISEKTVKHHLTRIFDKLGVSTRLELALLVVRHERESSDVPLHVEAAPRTPP